MKTTITVQNMMCEGCCSTIISELSKMDAISQVETQLANRSVSFELANNSDLIKVKEKLITLGYPPQPEAMNASEKSKSIFGRISDKFS